MKPVTENHSFTPVEQLVSHKAASEGRSRWVEVAAVIAVGAITVESKGKATELLELFPRAAELLEGDAIASVKSTPSVLSESLACTERSLSADTHVAPILNMSKGDRVKALISEHTPFEFVGRMERGTNGAYLVKDADDVHHIFKLVSPQDVTPQITMSARAAAAVDSLAARTPRYEQVKFSPQHGSWYVQEVLPGNPAPTPSDRLIGQMMTLNERQAGQAISGAENWNDKVLRELTGDKSGWKKNIARSGPEGVDLVSKVESFMGSTPLPNAIHGDIVHGDFQHYNALVSSSDRLTGYVDWEGAGIGDRSIDTSRMLYDAYVAEREIPGFRANPETLKMVADRIHDVSGAHGLRSYMGYWILQVADFGANMGGKDLSKFASVGRRIMRDLDFKKAAS